MLQSNANALAPAHASFAPGVLRILQVVTRLGVGGAEHGMLNVIAGLGDRDFDQRICVLRGTDRELVWNERIRVPVIEAGRDSSGLQVDAARLAQVFRKVRPHIVHSRNWGCLEAVIAARITGVPIAIHSEHGYELDMLNGMPMRRRIFRAIAFRAASEVFTVTRELRNYHANQAWIPASQIGVIYNGVDTHRFCPRPEAREAVRRRYGIGDRTCLIGTVGRLVPIKDQKTLLAAGAELRTRGLDVAVMVAGGGPLERELRNFATQSKLSRERALFTGATNDVPELLNAMDIFVLPSISEGMSNTLLEALSSGLPLVATSVGGNPEVLGDCGIQFVPRDVKGLVELLSALVENSEGRKAMAARARERAVNMFSLSKMISNYRDLYIGLAHRRGLVPAAEVCCVRN